MTALYFVLAFAITWGLQLPALLAHLGVVAGPPERFLALMGLGGFGPMLAAMIAARVEGTGVRALFRPLGVVRVGVWALVALLVPGILYALAASIWNAFGHAEPLVFPPDRPEYVAAALVFPFGEEIGWRGFALPRLCKAHGPIRATLVLGALWALWHVPMFVLQRVPPSGWVALCVLLVAGSFFMTWIWRRGRESLAIAVLAHVGAHLSNTGHALPADVTPLALHAAAYAVFAAALVGLDRAAFARRATIP